MSNQCSNLFSYRSFNFFPPFHSPLKPHATTPRPVFPFHGNLILIGRRSRNSTSSLPPPLAAGSSSDVVLVATEEHHDGSLIFQFGDASEVVKIVEVVEEIESEAELENNAVKVVDGDKEIPVVEKTIEGEDEVADEITNADIAERETNVTNDLRDYEESVERLSPISEEEVIVSQSDVKSNESLEGVESMLDKTECTTQVDDNESLNPHISLLDNSLNRDMSADTKETLSKDGDESEDQLVSVNLESIQPSDIEVMNVNPESTQPSYVEDELHNVETEDASESNTEDIMPHATMDIPDVELTDTANEDVNEELQDMDINAVTLIDEIPPSDPLGAESLDEVSEFQSVDVKIEATMEVSSTEAMDVKELGMEKEVQEVTMNKSNENDVAYLIPVSCTEDEEPLVEDKPQPTPVELQPGIHVSDIELNDTLTQDPDNEIVQTNDETEDLSVFVKLETMQVELVGVPQTDKLPKVEPEDTITSEMKDFPPQETLYISDAEIMDTVNEDMEEGLQDMNINDGTFIDEMLSSDLSEAEPTLDKVSQLQFGDVDFDVKDQPMEDELQQVSRDKNDEVNVDSVMPVTRIEETEQILEEEVTEPQLTPVELNPTMQVSDIELQDTMDQNLDEGILQVIDETEDPSESVKIEAMQVSETQVMDRTEPDMEDELPEVETEDTKESDVNYLVGPETMLTSDVVLTEAVNEDVEEVLQDMNNINEGTLIVATSDEVSQLQPVPVILEATREVLTTTEGMDVKDLCVEDELKQVSNENDVGYVMAAEPVLEEEVSEPCLTPVELKPTMEASDIEVEDTGGQDLDDGILQVIDENADDSYIKEDELSLFQLEAELVQDLGVNHNMSEQCAEIDALGSSILVEQGVNGSQLEAENIQGKVSSSELSEALEETAMQLATEAKVEREETYLTGYFLSSGAALLELPFKALTGGDDAYFVSSSKWLGVANGVSQWSFEGTIPGVYAHELMKTCEEIVSNKTSNVPITNPVQLLCRGVKETNMSGSSNILIANFNGQALHVANIGDTGFIIIRHGAVYKKSSPLLHEFHFALQVEDRDDPLQLVEEYIIELEEDDIIVSATDGLFDNLYEPEIAMVVTQSLQAGMKPEEVANVLATRAQEVGRSRFVRSPFSDAAQAAGYTGYIGGKQDNVAVIVSLVENRSSVVAD